MSGSMYDISSTIFSPEGRMFQVEYAQKAIDNSENIVGLKCKDGILLGSEKQMQSKLMIGSNRRIHQVDNSVGIALNGRLPDGRHIVNRARSESQSYLKQFAVDINTRVLVERVSQYVHAHTLYGSYRPFGTSAIVAGWDQYHGYSMFLIEPNGNCYGYKTVASGKSKQVAKAEIEKHDFSQISCQDALKHLAKILHMSHDDNKDKIFELEMSWVCDQSQQQYQAVPENLKQEAENHALAEIEREQNQ